MMNGNDLADQIMDACKDCDPKDSNPLSIQLKVQNTVASYIQDNMEISLMFSGTNATSGATKVINCKAHIQFPVFKFLPAPDSNTFAVLLATALKGGLIQAETSSLVVLAPPGTLNPAGFFSGFVPTDMSTKNKDFDAKQFSRKYWSNIVNQIKSNFINPVPYVATSDSGVFVGTASTVSIS